jgi:hypothetical protein
MFNVELFNLLEIDDLGECVGSSNLIFGVHCFEMISSRKETIQQTGLKVKILKCLCVSNIVQIFFPTFFFLDIIAQWRPFPVIDRYNLLI